MSIDQNRIKFESQNKDQKAFFSTLTKRVNKYFKDRNLSKKANTEMVIKTITMILLYVLPFAILLIFQPPFWSALILWTLMGLGMSGIGMNIMHDAIHGAFSNNKKVNELMGYTLNLVGGARFNWYLQHNVLHHTYTNIDQWDEDINGKGAIKLSPHSDLKWFQRPQWLYAVFVYGILTLYWVVAKDFVQFVKYTKNGMNKNSTLQNISIMTRIILLKAVYLFVFLVLPVWVFNIPFYQVLTGFLLMHFIAGVVLTVVFQLAHSVEETTHPLPNEEGNIENAWAIHQMETTVNFARDNKFLNWYLGGLNFQVEHHLLPHICHVHYPQIAPIVKETAEEFGVPYLEHETVTGAVKSHFNLLRVYGLPDLDEAIV